MIRKFFFLLGCLPLLTACGPEKAATYSAPVANPADVATSYSEADYQDPSIPDSVLYDKILGCLVGSAIGDAMGAPTEMWNQWAIRETYGYVDSLDILMREASPEGPWDINLPAGAGTDDTRWNYPPGPSPSTSRLPTAVASTACAPPPGRNPNPSRPTCANSAGSRNGPR